MQWPPIAVFENEFVKGLTSFDEEYGTTRDVVAMDKAMEKEWKTDAFAVAYMCIEDERWSPIMPRLRKQSIQLVKAAGVRVVATSIWLDLDLQGHLNFDEDSFHNLIASLQAAEEKDPMIGRWHYAYTTRSGMRLVYVLKYQMDVEQIEPYYRGLVQRFLEAGMGDYIDQGVFDWTRLFRLPKVIRDGVPTKNAMFYHSVSKPGSPLLNAQAEIEALGTATSKILASIPEEVDEDQPTDDEAAELLRFKEPMGTRVRETQWYKNVKKRSLNREFLPLALGEKPIGGEGQRNSNLAKFVGQSIGLLFPITGTGPREIYALWLPGIKRIIEDFGDDPKDPWRRVLWSLVCRFWSEQMAQEETQRVLEEHKEEVKAEAKLSMADAMAQWCDHPTLTSASEGERQRFVSRHSIVAVGPSYYVLRPDGYFSPTPIPLPNLVGAINSLGADAYIETTTTSLVNGVPITKPKSPSAVLADHMVIGSGVRASNGFDGAVAENLGSGEAKIVIPMFKRKTDLDPRYDEEVDEWLRRTFGHAYTEVATWIGFALAFEDGPICALSIVGPPAIGKKLFATGLAECIDTECYATGKDLMGRFTPTLRRTGLLVIDEGLPRSMTSDPADTFRSFISGDTITIEEKYKPSMEINNPLRILITANNDHALKSLYMNRDLTEHDRQALSQRLLHIDVGMGGAKYLAHKGGTQHTAQKGNRWIRGDAGQKSDYVIARHFLWLYEQRFHNKQLLFDAVDTSANAAGNRLLLEGAGTSAMAEEMAVYAGKSTELCHIIVCMINDEQHQDGVYIDKGTGEIQVKLNDAFLYYTKRCRQEGRRVDMDRRVFRKALQNISHNKDEDLRHGDEAKTRWWSLDLDILHRYCRDYGIVNNALEEAMK